MLLILAINWIYLNPLLGEKVRGDGVVQKLPAPPRHVIEKGLGGKKHRRRIEMDGDLQLVMKAQT
jgi:hypothetical protein